jgi:hypothetical protein
MNYDLHTALSDVPREDLNGLVNTFFQRMETGLETGDPFTRLYALIAVAGIDVLSAS